MDTTSFGTVPPVNEKFLRDDGWFSVTSTRDAHPLSGKVMRGSMVHLIGRAS